MVLGYTFILIIYKVLFDDHDILDGHDHDHFTDPLVQRASMILRQTMVKYKDSMISDNHNKDSQAEVDQALRQSMSSMFKKSEKFASKVSMSR